MSTPALIVSQSERLTPGLPAIVAGGEYEPVSTLVTDRAESGQYYLSPATITQIEQRITEMDDLPLVVVDGEPHPGQLVDLRARLQSATVVDKRRVVWDQLSKENPVAATRVSLRNARLARRHAAAAQRNAETRGPSGTSGEVADSDERIQTLREQLEQQQEAARRRVRTGHTAVDARVVLLGRVDAPTTPLWKALTGNEAIEDGLLARPMTAQTDVGPHTIAVTDTPGILGSDGLPQWLQEVVPGVVTAIEQATCVVGVGGDHEALIGSVADRFDVQSRSLTTADAATARTVLDELLPSVTCATKLPYGDDVQALVSELHDRTVIDETEYDDAIYMRLEVAQTAIEELRRRITTVGGELKRLDTGEDGNDAPSD